MSTKTFKERMEAAKANASQYGEALPFDAYTAIIKGCFRNKSQNGRNQINIDWIVAEGEFKGRTHRSFYNLDHDVGVSIMRQELSRIGFSEIDDCNGFEDVDELLKKIENTHPVCTIHITEKKGYTNTRVRGHLGNVDESDIPETVISNSSTETSSEPESSNNDVEEEPVTEGSKIKYRYDGKIFNGTVKEINYENETLSTAFHKGIKLDDLIAE